MDKQHRYFDIVKQRKDCRACGPDLKNPSEFLHGQFDGEEVGPWTRWQGDLNAEIVVVGQDWGGTNTFCRNQGQDLANCQTNKALVELLGSIGFVIGLPGTATPASRKVFFTNAILCLKQGRDSSPLRAAWRKNCGTKFLKPLIELIQPQAVVTLGVPAYHTIVELYDLPKRNISDAVEDLPDGEPLDERTRLFAMYHCGMLVRNRYRSLDEQKEDWQRVGRFVNG